MKEVIEGVVKIFEEIKQLRIDLRSEMKKKTALEQERDARLAEAESLLDSARMVIGAINSKRDPDAEALEFRISMWLRP